MTYLCISHRISVIKSCGGGCKKLAMWCVLCWVYLSHNHWSLVEGMVVMYAPVWSNMLESGPWICMVGLDIVMSLSGLHSLVFKVKCVASMGGRTNLRSLDWEKLIHGS